MTPTDEQLKEYRNWLIAYGLKKGGSQEDVEDSANYALTSLAEYHEMCQKANIKIKHWVVNDRIFLGKIMLRRLYWISESARLAHSNAVATC